MKPDQLLRQVSLLGLLFAALPATASWTLDNDASQLSFVSVKAGDAGEVHRFTQLTGAVADDGNATIEITGCPHGVKHRPVVGPVHARLYQYRALDA